MPSVGDGIAVDPAAASSIAAALTLRTAMIISEPSPGVSADPGDAMLQYVGQPKTIGFQVFRMWVGRKRSKEQTAWSRINQRKMRRKT